MDIWYTENHTDNVRLSFRIDRQLASVQSDFQRIDIFESVEFGRIMTLDGLLMLTEKDEYVYHEMITHIPMATNPGIRNVLVIGAGDGGTVRELCRYPTIEHIDMVEIDEMVVELSKKYLPFTACSLEDPRVNIHIQDGLRFVRRVDRLYDLIIVLPESDVYVLPDSLSYQDAVMIEPTTIAVQACSRAQLEFQDTVMIIGAGALGSSMLRIVNLYSPRKIIVVDIDEPKLEAALQNGATDVINSKTEDVVTRAKELTDGYGPTVVIDCACFHGSFLTACKAAGNASRVITMGFSIAPDEINQFVITSKELDVRGSRLQNHRFQTVIDLINKGKIDLNGSISHTFKLTDAQAAFDFNDTHDPSIRKIALLND